jgi:hypothetical protein
MPLHYRQGDLLFVLQETRPEGDLIARQSNVIVTGETTGHAHRLTAGAVLEASDGTLYLDLPYAAKVVHEEHNPITLDPGLWLVVRQREYSPEAIRTILD